MVLIPQSKKSDATTKARVLIVDDQPVVRERLVQLIRGEAGLELCGEADNPCRAFEMIVDKQPHLVVTGLALKDAHGLEFVKACISGILMSAYWYSPFSTNPFMPYARFVPEPMVS